MKRVLLILWLVLPCHAQTRLTQCNQSTTVADLRDGKPEAPAPAAGGAAAKPDNSRVSLTLVLPQVQYRRPPARRGTSCWCGTVNAGALTSEQVSQEVPMISLPGNFRFDHVMLQELKKFTSDIVSALAVSAGLPKSGEDLISNFALMSQTAPQNYVTEMPDPPALSGTYNLVLKFEGNSPLAIAGSSNFASGALNWEVCGYQVH